MVALGDTGFITEDTVISMVFALPNSRNVT